MNILVDPQLWWIPTTIYIAIGFVLVRWLEKKIVGLPSRTQRLLWQYVFCFGFAVLYYATGAKTSWDSNMSLIFLLGIGNGLAVFVRWKAVQISLSGTSVLSFLDDLVAMGLSFVILSEGRFLNPMLGLGILLSVGSIIFMALRKREKGWPAVFLLYVGTYSVIWGVAYFSQRFFALGDMAPSKYLLAWYGGSLLVAVLIRLFWKEKGVTAIGRNLSWKEIGTMLVISASVFTTVFLALNVLKHLPQMVFQPILLVSEAVIPTIMGLVIFGEHRGYSFLEKMLLSLAVIGVILIAFGLR